MWQNQRQWIAVEVLPQSETTFYLRYYLSPFARGNLGERRGYGQEVQGTACVHTLRPGERPQDPEVEEIGIKGHILYNYFQLFRKNGTTSE